MSGGTDGRKGRNAQAGSFEGLSSRPLPSLPRVRARFLEKQKPEHAIDNRDQDRCENGHSKTGDLKVLDELVCQPKQKRVDDENKEPESEENKGKGEKDERLKDQRIDQAVDERDEEGRRVVLDPNARKKTGDEKYGDAQEKNIPQECKHFTDLRGKSG